MISRKYRIHLILILSVLAIIIAPQITNRPDKNKSAAAAVAAEEFLQLVDAGQYADSWLISASYLKKTTSQEDWVTDLTKLRETVGAVSGRELKSVNFAAPTEEMPDSEMILLEYETKFKVKGEKEIITVILGEDNRWRVIGYSPR